MAIKEAHSMAADAESSTGSELGGSTNQVDSLTMCKRVVLAACAVSSTMFVTFASSIYATAVRQIVPQFHTSEEVATLGITVFVLGFVFGPMILAPACQLVGRKTPWLVALVGFAAFSFGGGVAHNIQSLLVCRFFSGLFGAGPLIITPAIFSDIFRDRSLGIAMLCFSFVVFAGPVLAQPIGGFIVMNASMGWRWTQHICGILGSVALILNCWVPETLHFRESSHANDERKLGSLPAYTFLDMLNESLLLPFKMLITEPIILLVCLFGSYVYALLYLCLSLYPQVFQKVHHMNAGVGGLPYLALMIGQLLGCLGIFITLGIIQAKSHGAPAPEKQLCIASPGAFLFGVGLIWLGWTGYNSRISWAIPMVSGLASGFGMLTAFVPSITYLVQIKPEKTASILAAHTMLRSLLAAGFPLFAQSMYSKLGINFSGLLLGLLAIGSVPIPLILLRLGQRLRG